MLAIKPQRSKPQGVTALTKQTVHRCYTQYPRHPFKMKNKSGFPANLSHWFDTKIHANQVGAYLPLFSNKDIEPINESQEKTDDLIPVYGGQYTNCCYFDNSKRSESAAKINEGCRGALAAFQCRPDEIFMYFGRITHALQDFYSHSNWYELPLGGLTGVSVSLMKDLVSLKSFTY